MPKKRTIINRFLALEFLKAFALVFFAVAGIMALFTIMQYMKLAGSREASPPLSAVAFFSLADIFKALPTIIPLSVLLAGSLTFWRLARSSELVVVRSIGLSVWKFLSPIMAACVAIGLLNMAVLSPIGAAVQARKEVLLYRHGMSHANPMVFSEQGLWLKEKGGAFTYIEQVRKEGGTLRATGITIFEVDGESGFGNRIEARSGTLTPDAFTLKGVKIIDPQLVETSAITLDYPTSLSIDRIEEKSSEPESVSFWDLPGYIKFFEEAGFSARGHRAYFYSLLLLPLSMVAMLFISAIFSISPKRNRVRLALKLTGGVLIGFAAFFLDQVVRALGTSGRLPLLAAMLFVPITAILISSLVLLYKEDG